MSAWQPLTVERAREWARSGLGLEDMIVRLGWPQGGTTWADLRQWLKAEGIWPDAWMEEPEWLDR